MSDESWDSTPSQKAEMIRKPAFNEGYRKGVVDVRDIIKNARHFAAMVSREYLLMEIEKLLEEKDGLESVT